MRKKDPVSDRVLHLSPLTSQICTILLVSRIPSKEILKTYLSSSLPTPRDSCLKGKEGKTRPTLTDINNQHAIFRTVPFSFGDVATSATVIILICLSNK